MANSTVWWLIAGVAIVVELLSGTVYLLLLAAGFAAAAISAHLGFGTVTQLIVAALIGVGAVLVWYSIQRKRPPAPPTEANRDVNLDIGESVHVDAWNADGTATVRYRGAQWTVIQRAGHTPSTGEHRVVEVVGSRLVVDKV
ncbi:MULTISPECIES: NfeD family protein [unclassified Variovorax]|uniref:NfeD family protein n=1 Tax=unclassified Variovorax TaxID=663243 RepID=UPI0008CA1ADD|nr:MULTISPECIES: NfeD family protein [unclassified Variovorax]SEJ73057.1 Membrane protein implicated in regulation of membrane protease activity [Variovorax sp. OK202]SFC84538.1 Membrane protein implicated in regulation of membrane protease activity [Variovorax sp. OK212]